MKTLVISSDGLNSVSLAHIIAARHQLTRLVSFDYGQRHRKELDFAGADARRLDVPHHLIDMRPIRSTLTGSTLTVDIDVPDGQYAEDTMCITMVPNRNAIMLAIGFGVSAAHGDEAVATAVHGGDHFIYLDCRPASTDAFDAMQQAALDGYADVRLHVPFVRRSKADIVRDRAALGTLFAETWSCYKGGEVRCGRCCTCVERREAFHLAGVADPTPYADPDYWVQAVAAREGR